MYHIVWATMTVCSFTCRIMKTGSMLASLKLLLVNLTGTCIWYYHSRLTVYPGVSIFFNVSCENPSKIKKREKGVLIPLLFVLHVFIHDNIIHAREGGGDPGWLWSHVDTDDACSTSTVSTYNYGPKETRKRPDQCALRLFGVLYRWFDRWTRLPANVLMPHTLESRTVTVSWLPRSSHELSPQIHFSAILA